MTVGDLMRGDCSCDGRQCDWCAALNYEEARILENSGRVHLQNFWRTKYSVGSALKQILNLDQIVR